MPPDPPVPVDADYDAPTHLLRVEFDRDLQVGVLDPSPWLLVWNMSRFSATAAQVPAGDVRTVVVNTAFVAPSIQPDHVNYSPPPFDVISQAGLPAAAFSNFPVHAPT